MDAKLRTRLMDAGEDRLLRLAETWTQEQQRQLAMQLEGIDLELVGRLFRAGAGGEDWGELARRAAPPPAFRLGGTDARFSAEAAVARGREALRAGEIGVLLVAGGQGARLGFDRPKGMFPIGPVSGASLFQILIEKIVATARRYDARVGLWIMTSPATDAETIRYLAEHDRFGLPEEDVRVFCQGTMPAVDRASGRLLAEAPGRLALSPDGHGGMLAALRDCGGLDAMAARGVRQLFYMQVDNPLTAVCDPLFLGYHLQSGSEISTQVVAKRDAGEKLGVVVEIDGRVRIIEYSDLPRAYAAAPNADGSLKLWAGSIAVHAFDVEFLRRAAMQTDALPFHRAIKTVASIDAEGRLVRPREPNAVKFERFIFDLLPLAERAIVVEVDPADSFAPLKDGEELGANTPDAVRRRMIELHTRWLKGTGAEVADGVPVEISPLLALDAEQLAERWLSIAPVDRPTYLR